MIKLCETCGNEFNAPRRHYSQCPNCFGKKNTPETGPKPAGPRANIDCTLCHGTGWTEWDRRHGSGRLLPYATRCECVVITEGHAADCSCYVCYHGRSDRMPGLHRYGCECTWCVADGGRHQDMATNVTDRQTALKYIRTFKDEVIKHTAAHSGDKNADFSDFPEEIRLRHSPAALGALRSARQRMEARKRAAGNAE